MCMYSYGHVCSVLCILFCCVILCNFYVQMCTVLLPPGVNQIVVNKYINIIDVAVCGLRLGQKKFFDITKLG